MQHYYVGYCIRHIKDSVDFQIFSFSKLIDQKIYHSISSAKYILPVSK